MNNNINGIIQLKNDDIAILSYNSIIQIWSFEISFFIYLFFIYKILFFKFLILIIFRKIYLFQLFMN